MSQKVVAKRRGSRVVPAAAALVAASEAETRNALLQRSGRTATPVLGQFVQAPPGSSPRHGPLAEFVRGRDLRGLQAYLLLLGLISSGQSEEGWSATLPIPTWARALGITQTATAASASTAVSKVFGRLVQRKLIEKSRHGRERQIRVTLLREDGSGQPYNRPLGEAGNKFFRLSHVYWTDGWHEQLDLPATAMLLVALHAKPDFQLATEHMPKWYGWSADTAERGLGTLVDLGLLTKKTQWVKAPLSPIGASKVNEYRLTDVFDQTLIPKLARKSTGKSAGKAAGKTTTATPTAPTGSKETAQ